MSLYTTENLLADAIKCYAKGSRENSKNERFPMQEVWRTLNLYILSCLERHRGLVIPNFCRFGWQGARKSGRSNSHLYFELLEVFSKTYGVSNCRFDPVALVADLGPMEDFNFSKAAICFSQKLTKDHISVGLRALVRQLGDVLGQGRLVSIEFDIGKLVGKDTEVRFMFSADVQKSLRDGHVTEPAQPLPRAVNSKLAGNAEEAEQLEVTSAGRTPYPHPPKIRGGSVRKEKGPRGNRKEQHSSNRLKQKPADVLSLDVIADNLSMARPTSRGARTLGEEKSQNPGGLLHCVAETLCTQSEKYNRSVNLAKEHKAPDLSRLCGRPDANGPLPLPLWTPRKTASSIMPENDPDPGWLNTPRSGLMQLCFDESVHRHISSLEKRALEAVRNRAEQSQFAVESWEQREIRERRAAMNRENSQFLQRQMKEKENRRKVELELERASDVGSIKSTPLQGCVGLTLQKRDLLASQEKDESRDFIAEAITKDALLAGLPRPASLLGHVKASSELKEQLDQQIEAKKAMREATWQHERNAEISRLEADSQEASQLAQLEKKHKQQRREQLSEAWRGARKIRDVDRSIQALEEGRRAPVGKVTSLPGSATDLRPLSATLTQHFNGNLASVISSIAPLSARPGTSV